MGREWASQNATLSLHQARDPRAITVAKLTAYFMAQRVATYYVTPDGKPTSEVQNFRGVPSVIEGVIVWKSP